MRILDRPENRKKLVQYVSEFGQTKGSGLVLRCSDSTIEHTLAVDANLKEQVELAKAEWQQRLNKRQEQARTSTLQEHWDAARSENNALLFQQLLELLTSGEVIVETRVFEKPDKGTGEYIVDKRVTNSIRKPPPKWACELGLKLMAGQQDTPELLRAIPTVLLELAKYFQQEGRFSGEDLQEIVATISEFEKFFSAKIYALFGKNRTK